MARSALSAEIKSCFTIDSIKKCLFIKRTLTTLCNCLVVFIRVHIPRYEMMQIVRPYCVVHNLKHILLLTGCECMTISFFNNPVSRSFQLYRIKRNVSIRGRANIEISIAAFLGDCHSSRRYGFRIRIKLSRRTDSVTDFVQLLIHSCV